MKPDESKAIKMLLEGKIAVVFFSQKSGLVHEQIVTRQQYLNLEKLHASKDIVIQEAWIIGGRCISN